MKFKLNKLQIEFLLKFNRLLLIFYVLWESYWLFIYDLIVWRKPFFLVLYLDKIIFILFCIAGLALIEVLIANPQLLLPKKRGKRTPKKPQKAEEKKKPKEKEMPMY